MNELEKISLKFYNSVFKKKNYNNKNRRYIFIFFWKIY